MIKIEVDKTSFNKVNQRLKKVSYKVRTNVMRKGMRRFTALIRNRARELAPVRTGNLKKSITSKTSSRAKTGMIIGRVFVSRKRGVHYGHIQEYGSFVRKQPARRFMTRAFEDFNNSDLFGHIVNAALDEELRKMGLAK
jgi:HK97 gp10 family phage protein